VWPPIGKKKFETLSYLPDLSDVELAKEVDYLLRNKWIPCVEFELEVINTKVFFCLLIIIIYSFSLLEILAYNRIF